MRTVKLVIGFDGTRYAGWQSQRKGNSIQEMLESNLLKLFKEKTSLVSSSRTDAGVHARGMVAHFKTKCVLSDLKIKRALNYYLPKDILIYSSRTVSDKFHARYDAKSKLYCYDIWNSPLRPLFESSYVLWFPKNLDINKMKKACAFFKGQHDFSAFCDKGDPKESYVRCIKRIRIRKIKSIIRIEVEANGFLRHMVRVIVGTLVEVGRSKMNFNNIQDILKSKDRKQAGPTIKPKGLTLMRVKY